ncbi:MAG TPA: hypothetical protein VGR95_12505 [Thermoanaerobaculia bacterium]|jgi:hypothetical protein|nr:hypothetical protein [Thermoanaerobaculia bacterium]
MKPYLIETHGDRRAYFFRSARNHRLSIGFSIERVRPPRGRRVKVFTGKEPETLAEVLRLGEVYVAGAKWIAKEIVRLDDVEVILV